MPMLGLGFHTLSSPLGPDFERGLLLCCTELTSSEQVERFAAALAEVGGGR